MTKIFYRTAMILGLSMAGPALAAETATLTHQGVTYVYSVTEKGSAKIIEGVDRTNNRPFRLRVAHGWVEGRVDGAAVSFSLRDVKPVTSTTATAATSTLVAAR
jgi:hypothetical protein